MNLMNKKENTFSASVYYRNEHTVYTLMAITSKQNLIIMNKRTSTSKRINYVYFLTQHQLHSLF